MNQYGIVPMIADGVVGVSPVWTCTKLTTEKSR